MWHKQGNPGRKGARQGRIPKAGFQTAIVSISATTWGPAPLPPAEYEAPENRCHMDCSRNAHNRRTPVRRIWQDHGPVLCLFDRFCGNGVFPDRPHSDPHPRPVGRPGPARPLHMRNIYGEQSDPAHSPRAPCVPPRAPLCAGADSQPATARARLAGRNVGFTSACRSWRGLYPAGKSALLAPTDAENSRDR